MISTMKKGLLASAMLLAAAASHATAVQNTTGLAGATNTITFSELPLTPGTIVTNQYAADGASFASFAAFRPQDGFFATDYIGNFSGQGIANPFEIIFTHAVSGAAFDFISNPGTTQFEALLGGSVVGSFTANTSTTAGNYYGFDGMTFDTIRITSPVNGAMEMDNLEFRTAVPEPESIALMALGLAAIALRARRKA
jgi:hypothetical protein